MKGLELSKKYYKEFGEPMLKEQFASVLPYLAVGLVGSGSECYGFDDEISQDHDFEPAFCIFVPDDTDDKTLFELERAYSKLPREFMGFERSLVSSSRHGVIKIGDFYEQKTGSRNGLLSLGQWLSVPENFLSEATNGEIFLDNLGDFTSIRDSISYFPKDIWLKKLAGHLFSMSQTGLYNYERCLKRGDSGACQLSLFEFVKSALNVIFILNKTYMPYYKWAFRSLSELKILSELSLPLEKLISSANTPAETEKKKKAVQDICEAVANELKAAGLVKTDATEIQAHALAINDSIADINIRTLHLLAAV